MRKLFRSRSEGKKGAPASNLQGVLKKGTPPAVSSWLTNENHDLMDDQVAALSETDAEKLTDLLTPNSARELLESITPYTGHDFIKKLPLPMAAGLLDTLEADDAARILDQMDEDDTRQILKAMEFSHSALVRGLLAWPPDSAASRMRPEFISVRADADVATAIAAARRDPDDLEEGVFVTKDTPKGEVVLGWLSPQDLIVAKRAAPVVDHMMSASRLQQWSVKPLADQETVSDRVRAHDSYIVPVMDGFYLLGVITRDSIRDIFREEATEDAEMQGGSVPLDVPYLKASPVTLWRKRVVWLLVLFIASMYTGNVLQAFEDVLEAVVALNFFIPLLIGTGGNVGTQITTTLIRAMAADGVQMKDMGRVLAKELSTGTLIAVTMAAAGLVRAWTLGVAWPVMVTVTVSLAAIVLWSSLVASLLPLILRRVGLDPAVVSAPMIATVVDGTGLLIYFMIAQALIPGL